MPRITYSLNFPADIVLVIGYFRARTDKNGASRQMAKIVVRVFLTRYQMRQHGSRTPDSATVRAVPDVSLLFMSVLSPPGSRPAGHRSELSPNNRARVEVPEVSMNKPSSENYGGAGMRVVDRPTKEGVRSESAVTSRTAASTRVPEKTTSSA
eukprot:scaffold162347_cov15-Prasinocladus_malaysianus.AAC.1